MLRLITAVPGSGKTLYCVGLIRDLVNAKEPRLVFSNILGLNIDSELLREAPDDWRTVPDGSVIFYDECQELFPATGKAGRVEDAVLTDLETHRHRGIDIYFITQHPTFVHHHIRKLCGEHIHFYRAHGTPASVKYIWSHIVLDPNDRAEQRRANVSIFKFDKSLYPLYKSTTLDTHKFKMPKKFYYFLFGILGIFGLAFYLFSSSSMFDPLTDKKAGDQALALPLSPSVSRETYVSWSDAPEVTTVAGCVHFEPKRNCVCYSNKGNPLSLTYGQCVSALSRPLPYNINIDKEKESDSSSTD